MKKNNLVSVRFSDPQMDLISRAAEIEGVNPTEFLRQCSLEQARQILKAQPVSVAS
jgi:uncharacterized protein (DUF1778 family)